MQCVTVLGFYIEMEFPNTYPRTIVKQQSHITPLWVTSSSGCWDSDWAGVLEAEVLGAGVLGAGGLELDVLELDDLELVLFSAK